MSKSLDSDEKRALVRALLKRHPKSYAESLGLDLSKNTPAPLYCWLICSLLFSARISADQAQRAAGALFDQGWKTPRAMAETSWEARVRVLNRSGYARYDESTARYIADTTELLQKDYKGDLRRLREAAGRDPAAERERLKAFKGIGEVGADIFFREVQVAWEELYPFADRKALQVAGRLGLPDSAGGLAALVRRKRDLPRLLAALVRADLNKELDALRREAA